MSDAYFDHPRIRELTDQEQKHAPDVYRSPEGMAVMCPGVKVEGEETTHTGGTAILTIQYMHDKFLGCCIRYGSNGECEHDEKRRPCTQLKPVQKD